jgi:hypothetical protein
MYDGLCKCPRYVMTAYVKGKTVKLDPSALSPRMPQVWQRLGFDPGKGRRGVNAARHAAVAHCRKRRKLSPEERAEELDQAKRRLSSVHMAETVYG